MQTFFTGRVVEMNSLGCPASFISNGYQPGPRRKKESGLHFELEMNIAGVWRLDAFLLTADCALQENFKTLVYICGSFRDSIQCAPEQPATL